MEKSENFQLNEDPYRKIICTSISQIINEKGFESVDEDCLQSLTELVLSLILEIGQSARGLSELAGRTLPVCGDVVLALVNMGISLKGIESFAQREGRQIITMPPQSVQQKQPSLLQAGAKSQHPPYIPNYLPVLPDPHAYIRTPTHKQPVTEYEAIREKAATQKRDVERALTKFLSRTSETESLFEEEDNTFPLIACKPSIPTYLAALNPTDQVFDFEELEYHYLVANRTEDVTTKEEPDEENESGHEEERDNRERDRDRERDREREEVPKLEIKTETDIKQENDIKPNSSTNKAILENPNIDNPYLRAATLPKRSKPDPTLLLSTPITTQPS